MSRVPDQTIKVVAELAAGFYHMVWQFDLLLSLLDVGVVPGPTQLPGELLVELLYGSGFAPGGFITDVEAALLLLQSSQIVEIRPSLSGVAEPDETLALVVVHLHQDPEVDKTVRVMDQDILPFCEGSGVWLVCGVWVCQGGAGGGGELVSPGRRGTRDRSWQCCEWHFALPN